MKDGCFDGDSCWDVEVVWIGEDRPAGCWSCMLRSVSMSICCSSKPSSENERLVTLLTSEARPGVFVTERSPVPPRGGGDAARLVEAKVLLVRFGIGSLVPVE